MRRLLAGAAVWALAGAAPVHAADVDVIVGASRDAPLREARAAARSAGLTPHASFRALHAFHATGPAAALQRLQRSRRIRRVERNRRVPLLTDTSHTATRGRELLIGTPRYDGSGIGVGVVDTGFDGTHPDLEKRLATNVRIVPVTRQTAESPHTDLMTLGGHGTAVAGAALGDGTASAGRFHGAAPGASLHGISVGAGAHLMVDTFAAWEWILANHRRLDPPIRVVNNSFGGQDAEGSGTYEPGSFQFELIDEIVGAGVTMVFAAGNGGGDGSVRQTTDYCLDPTPGVICVANYDDANAGTFGGTVMSGSSRGLKGRQETYPDLMAPGTEIMAACRPFLPVCAAGTPSTEFPLEYSAHTGTSMAAPHAAGIVAQLLQARPDLSPGQVEALLVQTARPVPTGAAYEPDRERPGVTSFDKGHGLIDAKAAVDRALAPPPPPVAAPAAAEAPASAPAPAPPQLVVRRRGRRLTVGLSGPAQKSVRVRVLRGRRVVARGRITTRAIVLRVPRRGRLRVEARFGRNVLRAWA